MILQQRVVMGCIRRSTASRLREVIICSALVEAIPEVMSPFLGSLVRERHGHVGESLAEDH